MYVIKNFLIQEANKFPMRVSKQPIFISIACEGDKSFNDLSGKYNFHSIKNNVPAFLREGGPLESFEEHPYYLVHTGTKWCIQSSRSFDDGKTIAWIHINTESKL